MQRRALIVGLGIAGMSAAIGLRAAGWTPVIVERARRRRRGGYFIGLLSEGKRAAISLGIAKNLHTRNPVEGGKSWELDRRGKEAPGLGFLHRPGHPSAVIRGDLEAALWSAVAGENGDEPIEVRFGTTIVGIDAVTVHSRERIAIQLEDRLTGHDYGEEFDLVVGADGMRSSVRRLVFGAHEDFMRDWNAMICAFQLRDQVPSHGAQDSLVSARAGRAAWVFGFADRSPTALLTYRTSDTAAEFAGDRLERLLSAFAGMDDQVVRHVLQGMEQATEYQFDSVHQVKMPHWSKGPVVLAGDAAWCLNLYSGMGAASALKGGDALGRTLTEHPSDTVSALRSWETDLRPFIEMNQRLTRVKQQIFVPTDRVTEAVRLSAFRLAGAVREQKLFRARIRAAHGGTRGRMD